MSKKQTAEQEEQQVMEAKNASSDTEINPQSKDLVTQEQAVSRRGRKKAEVDQNLIDEAVKVIREKHDEHVYRGAIEIGSWIFENFFDNDPELAASKNPKKAASYRELCLRDDLPISPSTLNRMVNVARQEQIFLDNGIDVNQLNYTHRLELLRIENKTAKLEKARKTIEESMSAKQLRNEVSEEKKEISSNTNTEENPHQEQGMKLFRQLIPSRVFGRIDFMDANVMHLDSKKRIELKKQADDALQILKEVNKVLNKMVKDIDKSEKETPSESSAS